MWSSGLLLFNTVDSTEYIMDYIGLLMRNIYNVTKTPFQQEVAVALKCVCSLLNIKGICFAIMSFQSHLCLHSPLPGFESRPGHVGKLPVTRS